MFANARLRLLSWTMFMLCAASLLVFLILSESLRCFCAELARIGGALASQ